jgi:glycosyltransferase involved in cell wall biosynthesis/ADP-heptose:LPS heptosyltransferase
MKPPPPSPVPLVPARLLENPAKILFVMHPGIGDFCYLQNFFRELAARFPLLEMHLWVGEHRITADPAKWDALKNFILYDWLAACPYFKKIYRNNYSPAGLAGAVVEARAEKYDAVATLVLTRWHKYAKLAREICPAGAGAGIVISAMRPFDIKGWLKTFPYKKPDIAFPAAPATVGHISDIFSWWFQRLFGCGLPVEKRMPFMDIPGEWTRWADGFIKKIGADGKKLVFVNVTAKDWKRCWPLENGIETIKAMQQVSQWKDAIFLLNAMPGDVAKFHDTVSKGGLKRTHLFSAEENFFQLPSVLGKCSLIISVETSVMHLANAVRVPVIALMRKKYAWIWYPLDGNNTTLITTGKRGDHMDRIPVGRVMCAISEQAQTAAMQSPPVPLVSVLVPVYNTNPEHLREAIDSILRQTFTNFELVILNDSPDNIELEKFILSCNDPRIVYAKNERNLGITPSRNRLLEMARGEFLAVFDHDDISVPERLELEVRYLQKNPFTGIVSGQYQMFGGKIKTSRHPSSDTDIKISLTNHCVIWHTAAMIRKSVLATTGIKYEEKFSPAEDHRLWTRLIAHTNFHNIDKVLVHYRWHGGNATKTQSQKMKDAGDAVRQEVRETHPYLWSEFKKRRGMRIRLFGILPLVHIAKGRDCYFRVKLFGFLPILKWSER